MSIHFREERKTLPSDRLSEHMSHLAIEDTPGRSSKKIQAKFCILPPIPSLSEWYNLRRLDVTHCELTTVPSGIGNLPKIRYINLSHNDLQSLPDEIFKAPALKTLIAHHNALCTPIPLSLLKSSLTTLELHHNALQSEHFPTEAEMKKSSLRLKRLVLDDHISRARDSLSPLPLKKNRTVISIAQESRSYTPRILSPIEQDSRESIKIQFDLSEILRGTTLSQVTYENLLSYLPENIAIQHARHLSSLEPIQLDNVTHIMITDDHHLERFLPKIQKAINLEVLILKNCKIHTLSKTFFKKMTKLQYLDLSDNNLSAIPELSPSVKICHLDNNRITHLPSLPEGLLSLTMNGNMLGIEPPFTFSFPCSLKVLELKSNCILFDLFFSQKIHPQTHLNLTTLKMDLRAAENPHKKIYQPIAMEASYRPEYSSEIDLNWLSRIQTTPVYKKHVRDPLIRKKCGISSR